MLFVVLWGEYEKYSESPPTRLFSMTLVLSYWLGLLDASNTHELHPEAIGDMGKNIEKAYQMGKVSHPNSKSDQQ